MDLGERCLSQQELVDLDVVFGCCSVVGIRIGIGTCNALKGRIPDHKVPAVPDVVGFGQFLQEASRLTSASGGCFGCLLGFDHLDQPHHATPQLNGRRSVQMRMVPVQSIRMIVRQPKAVAITLAGLDFNVRGVRVVRSDRIEHVDLHVQSVQVQIGGVEILWYVGRVHLHEIGGSGRVFVVLVLDFFAGRDQAGPVVVGGHVQRAEVLGFFGMQLVAELDPHRLAGRHRECGTHVRSVGDPAGGGIGAGKGSSPVGVVAKPHLDGLHASD
mmetsp:Transcript_11911/g.25161  ORF Transcript_11911/g.25161 Transcript_11911/m.25161 type:complete len:271 (-) Transcript_11911:358-1170(-)